MYTNLSTVNAKKRNDGIEIIELGDDSASNSSSDIEPQNSNNFRKHSLRVGKQSSIDKKTSPSSETEDTAELDNSSSSHSSVDNIMPTKSKPKTQLGTSPNNSKIHTTSIGRRQTFEEKLGIRAKPKRPATAFFKYVADFVRPTILKESPGASVTQITKIAAERWKTEQDEVKNRLKSRFTEDMKTYRLEMETYAKELATVDQKLIAKFDPKLKKEKKELKKKREQLGCPKKPPSAYIMYLQSKSSGRAATPHKEWMTKIAAEWNSLNLEEKAKYIKTQETGMALYNKKMAAWEQEMKNSGNSDILKAKTPSKRSFME